MIGADQVASIEQRILNLLMRHRVQADEGPLDGAFSLTPGRTEADLYGMVDSVYILYTLGKLGEHTTRRSRNVWAARILDCQDEAGWFSRRNLRGHREEHATAYAVGALRLLALENDENYLESLKPFAAIRPLLDDPQRAERWITRMGFHNLLDIPRKNVGWHHVWRSSHIGGGVAAAIGMAGELVNGWWESVNVDAWFEWYFNWLDEHVDPQTGFWRRAFWNRIYRKPTLIDLGGATHFLWVYTGRDRPVPFPDRVIQSTAALQKASGLYRDYPYCIDLDANYCLIRPFLELDEGGRTRLRPLVERAVRRNFGAVRDALLTADLDTIYSDLHGPPGALAALVECRKLPELAGLSALDGWRHPLDETWWL